MNQLFLGAALPFAVCVLVYARKGCRASLPLLILAPVAMGLGALWAVAPDIPRLAGHAALYDRLARDPRTDIFFWHFTIDRIEGDAFLFMCGLGAMGLLLIAAAWRELYLREI